MYLALHKVCIHCVTFSTVETNFCYQTQLVMSALPRFATPHIHCIRSVAVVM